MNKNGAAAGPPSAGPPETPPVPATSSAGPVVETPQVHDSTLKWCIPDVRANSEAPLANLPSVNSPALSGQDDMTPKAPRLPEVLAESEIKGALPQAVQESPLDGRRLEARVSRSLLPTAWQSLVTLSRLVRRTRCQW